MRRFARLGADRDTIITGLGFTAEQLRDAEVLKNLQEEMSRGEALYKMDLLQDVARLRSGGNGSVNATIASLRQALSWDRPDSARGLERKRPDAEGAVAEIERLLKRFRDAPR